MRMINSISEFWNDKGHEIIFWVSLVIIIYFVICSFSKERGTWDDNAFEKNRYIQARPSIKKRGSGHDSRGEVRCREYLENRFGVPFNKARPDFLRNQVTSSNTKDNNLELDCFNQSLRLAVEYNGEQHYKFIPYFHRSRETFHNQKYRDEIKKYKCKENGIVLIEVPYNVKDIESYLESQLRANGY